MNQHTPEWDTPPRPDDYRAEVPGPYTRPHPRLPDPYQTVKPPRWGVVTMIGALGALLIGGLFVSASRDNTPVPVPNSGEPTSVAAPAPTTPTPTTPTPRPGKPLPVSKTDQSCNMLRVIDGDTIEVKCASGKAKVRVIGVDTPEVHGKKQCYGPEATETALEILGHGDEGRPYAEIYLTNDTTQPDKDRYGRLLRYVDVHTHNPAFLGGPWDLGEYLIERGAAREYTYGALYERRSTYKKVEALAKLEQMGMWGACPGVGS